MFVEERALPFPRYYNRAEMDGEPGTFVTRNYHFA